MKNNDGRKNNKGIIKPTEEKKIPITFYVKAKNKEVIKGKIDPIVKRMDK